MADNLAEILAIARQEMPDVPASDWKRVERLIRLTFGGQRPYIAAHKKRRHLEALAAADETADAQRMAAILGISVRRIQQLNKLK
jgi:hypothetical protein